MKNIKLVVSDMDGTLLNSKHEVSDNFSNLYNQLKNNGVRFVAASGRPFYSIIEKLKHIDNNLTIIAENGALVVDKSHVIICNAIDKVELKKLYNNVTSIENTYPIFCTKDVAYIKRTSDELIKTFSEYYSNFEIIETYDEIKADVIKIALYHDINSEEHIYPHVKQFNTKFNVVVSGNHWVDISENISNKGTALKFLQKHLNILASETMAFGDYNNDLEMLENAHYSYAMANAHENVKKISNYKTKSNDENGVELVLEELLLAIKS